MWHDATAGQSTGFPPDIDWNHAFAADLIAAVRRDLTVTAC
jgi:hypothetical protein